MTDKREQYDWRPEKNFDGMTDVYESNTTECLKKLNWQYLGSMKIPTILCNVDLD